MRKLFYVYSLAYQDRIFYVGSGSENDIDRHETDAQNGSQAKLAETIRRIWAEGGTVKKRVLLETDSESEANQLEIKLNRVLGLNSSE